MEKPFDHRPRGRRSWSTRWSRLTPILSLGFAASSQVRGGRPRAAADCSLERSCLQPGGSQLAIRPALLSAQSARQPFMKQPPRNPERAEAGCPRHGESMSRRSRVSRRRSLGDLDGRR